MYHCSTCKLRVIVIGERVIRACRCGDVAIVASMSATAHGSASVKTG